MDFEKLIEENPAEYARMLSDPDFKKKYPEQYKKQLESLRHLSEMPHISIDEDSNPEQVQQEMKTFR